MPKSSGSGQFEQPDFASLGQRSLEVYQAFMTGYVQRINNATLKVDIGGVRIGTAKYSRLAQINLQTRIITFSRYAIENVPERGRRYLVIHELAHVREASHNKRFWQIVERYEPDYRQVGKSIQLAFSQNVKQGHQQARTIRLLSSSSQLTIQSAGATPLPGHPKKIDKQGLLLLEDELSTAGLSGSQEDFYCPEDEYGNESGYEWGIMHGGSMLEFAEPH